MGQQEHAATDVLARSLPSGEHLQEAADRLGSIQRCPVGLLLGVNLRIHEGLGVPVVVESVWKFRCQ